GRQRSAIYFPREKCHAAIETATKNAKRRGLGRKRRLSFDLVVVRQLPECVARSMPSEIRRITNVNSKSTRKERTPTKRVRIPTPRLISPSAGDDSKPRTT